MQLIENIKTLTVQILHHIQKASVCWRPQKTRGLHTLMKPRLTMLRHRASSLISFTFMSPLGPQINTEQ